MKRCVAMLALLFGTGLMSMGGMLACVYGMHACELTPACHQHQQPVKCKSDCCRTGFATNQTATLTRSNLTPGVMANTTVSATIALVIAVGMRPVAVNRSDGPSPRILTLRV